MSVISGAVTIKVSSDALQKKAAEVSSRITSVSNRFTELEQIIRSTKHYWIGEAGDVHRSLYEERKSDVQLMIRRLREYPTELLQISGNYVAAEKTVEDSFSGLGGDVII